MNPKKALITGISGQDGYHIVKLLLSKNYEVYGILRRKTTDRFGNLSSLPEQDLKKIKFLDGDITDMSFIISIMKTVKPDEVYHLAAMSFVQYSFFNPETTYKTNFIATYYLLESIKAFSKDTKFFFACSSESYGNSEDKIQSLSTRFAPVSPYGISKASSFHLVKMYREVYGLFAVNGISFNHESEFRGPEFVTRKISMFVGSYAKTHQGVLEMGNLEARRDWGHSEDFVEGFWLSLQKPKPQDYIFANNVTNSVREFIDAAFKVIGREIKWQGEGLNEVGIDTGSQKIVVRVSKEFFRHRDINLLFGDSSLARKELNWSTKVKFQDLVRRMVQNDVRLAEAKSGSPKL